MRFLIGTAHFFAPIYRDAGMHRFAKSLAAKGHHVDFVTFGQSWLKQCTKPQARRYAVSAVSAARKGQNPPNLYAHVHREMFHPLSGSPRAERFTQWFERLYGRMLDPWTQEAAREADVVILECGYAPYYFDAIRRLNDHAKMVAFYNDRLDLVGFRSETLALNDRMMPLFDLVRTNSEALLSYLPAGANGHYIPQGVDKEKICFNSPSPYEPGTRNIVSIGNMLFDNSAVREIAAAAAAQDAEVHVIGAFMENPPSNVTVHGEMPFERTLPFIIHADVGLAPYRPVDGADYLIQSSLKIQQYSYCGLPILVASQLGITGDNFVLYDRSLPNNVANAVSQAFAMGKSREYGRDVRGWDEVGDILIDVITSTAHREHVDMRLAE